MEAREELQQFIGLITKLKVALNNFLKYKGNKHYKTQLDALAQKLNHDYKFLKVKVQKVSNDELKEKFKIVEEHVSALLQDAKYEQKLKSIKKLEQFWPDLEIEFENLKLNIKSFDIPEEIPITEYRLDLEEAIKDFDNGCFVSSLVMCRRAYEGALVSLYRSKTGKEPIDIAKCKSCNNIIREKAYLGIAKLHSWAIDNKLITDKLKQVGFLLTDMGAGAAHPPLTEFPRDKDIARLGITATIALLKELTK